MSNPQEFNPASLDQWAKAAAKSAPGGDVSALNWVTPEGITVKPLYTAADTAELPFAKEAARGLTDAAENLQSSRFWIYTHAD